MRLSLPMGSQRFQGQLKAALPFPEIDIQFVGHINPIRHGLQGLASPGNGTPFTRTLGQRQAQMAAVQAFPVLDAAGTRPEQWYWVADSKGLEPFQGRPKLPIHLLQS